MISRNILGFRDSKIWSIVNRVRWSSFRSSEPYTDIENHPKVVVERNPPEWKYVETLLGCRVIPVPFEKAEFSSNWKPQNVLKAQQSPYYIERTKNYMCPVYLNKTFRGQRQITKIRRIEGDIWKLEEDLRLLIEKTKSKPTASRVNEMSRQIQFKGDHVEIIKAFLMDKGL